MSKREWLGDLTEEERRALAFFGGEADKVLSLAHEEAQRLQHNFIDTGHILLGLVREDQEFASVILRNLGVELDAARNAVKLRRSRELETIPSGIGLSPRLKGAFRLIVAEVDRQNQFHRIWPTHLLLGIVDMHGSIAVDVLEGLGVNLEKLRILAIWALSGVAFSPLTSTSGKEEMVMFETLERHELERKLTPASGKEEMVTVGVYAGEPKNSVLVGYVEADGFIYWGSDPSRKRIVGFVEKQTLGPPPYDEANVYRIIDGLPKLVGFIEWPKEASVDGDSFRGLYEKTDQRDNKKEVGFVTTRGRVYRAELTSFFGNVPAKLIGFISPAIGRLSMGGAALLLLLNIGESRKQVEYKKERFGWSDAPMTVQGDGKDSYVMEAPYKRLLHEIESQFSDGWNFAKAPDKAISWELTDKKNTVWRHHPKSALVTGCTVILRRWIG